jgi:hypothetical protein
MKRWVIMAALAAMLATAWPSYAQPGPPGRRADRPYPGPYQGQPMPPPQRSYERREEGPPGRRQPLSPEERRQLRRDIEDTGRDIYRDRRR